MSFRIRNPLDEIEDQIIALLSGGGGNVFIVSSSSNFRSIQSAVDAAERAIADGTIDTALVQVASGEYVENVTVSWEGVDLIGSEVQIDGSVTFDLSNANDTRGETVFSMMGFVVEGDLHIKLYNDDGRRSVHLTKVFVRNGNTLLEGVNPSVAPDSGYCNVYIHSCQFHNDGADAGINYGFSLVSVRARILVFSCEFHTRVSLNCSDGFGAFPDGDNYVVFQGCNFLFPEMTAAKGNGISINNELEVDLMGCNLRTFSGNPATTDVIIQNQTNQRVFIANCFADIAGTAATVFLVRSIAGSRLEIAGLYAPPAGANQVTVVKINGGNVIIGALATTIA